MSKQPITASTVVDQGYAIEHIERYTNLAEMEAAVRALLPLLRSGKEVIGYTLIPFGPRDDGLPADGFVTLQLAK